MKQPISLRKRIAILGAGCSGLSVAWGLCEHKESKVAILESSDRVGGLSQTIEREGIKFDIGPHRLSPQLPGIIEKIGNLPGTDLLEIENEHGVYFNGTVYSYPPKPADICNASSLKHTALFAGGWLLARISNVLRNQKAKDISFEDIILHSFGRPFSEMVAFPMIHKVWGTKDLHEDFARVRFELPTIGTMLKRFLIGKSIPGVKLFYYPRQGFGRIPEAISRHIQLKGSIIELSSKIKCIEADSLKGPFIVHYEKGAEQKMIEADVIVSTIPNNSLIEYLPQDLAKPILPLAASFPSRTMRLGIILVKGYRLPARVIIFPEKEILFNRLSSYDRFSPEISPEGYAVIMCDVICDQGSAYDIMKEDEFNELLLESVLKLGWFKKDDIAKYFSIRIPGAYPVLNRQRYQAQEQIESFFKGSGIILCGREASSDYNNAHNAIGKGLLTARYIAGEIDDSSLKDQARTVGRLPIQD